MRIISGLFKGKKILQPTDKITRPLKDLTKESIFNVIEHSNKFSVNIKNSFILDLYSGVGSFGLECLSREAKHVTFIENYKGVLPILKKNLFSLKNINNYEILNQDINLKSEIILSKLRQKNDIVFLDPPFKDKNLNEIIFAQKIATEKIFLSKKIPFRSFKIFRRNEETLGELFTFFILETILIASALKINPYDQPAVELIKKETVKRLI